MTTKRLPPGLLDCVDYEHYKHELEAWKKLTDLPKKKQAFDIALSLPLDKDDPDGRKIRSQVFENVKIEDLEKDDGVPTLITYMDGLLKKEDIADAADKYDDFEDLKRGPSDKINDYITDFDLKYNRLVKLDIKISSVVLAFKLLKGANITHNEKLLVLSGMNYGEKDTLYDQAKKSLKKFLGSTAGDGANSSSSTTPAVKLEPTFLADHEEALVAAGYVHQSKLQWKGYSHNRGRGQWRGPGGGAGGSRGAYNGAGRGVKKERKVNPNGSDGKPMLCISCGSYRHLMANCPDSWENMSVNIVEEKAVLFTGYHKSSIAQLGIEARNSCVLDSACSSTVTGQAWIDDYIESLDETDREQITKEEGKKMFKFGGGEKLKSKGSYTIPAVLAGQEVKIQTDVVDSDIPLLLSMDAMKRARMKLDLENDTAEILGVKVATSELLMAVTFVLGQIS